MMVMLSLLGYPLEWLWVGFLVDELTSVAVALHPAVVVRVEGLGTVPHCASALSISCRFVCGHRVTASGNAAGCRGCCRLRRLVRTG